MAEIDWTLIVSAAQAAALEQRKLEGATREITDWVLLTRDK